MQISRLSTLSISSGPDEKYETKINWKLAAAGAGAILSAGILLYSFYHNFYKIPVEPAEVQQVEQQEGITESHRQPFTQSDLSEKLNDNNRLK